MLHSTVYSERMAQDGYWFKPSSGRWHRIQPSLTQEDPGLCYRLSSGLSLVTVFGREANELYCRGNRKPESMLSSMMGKCGNEKQETCKVQVISLLIFQGNQYTQYWTQTHTQPPLINTSSSHTHTYTLPLNPCPNQVQSQEKLRYKTLSARVHEKDLETTFHRLLEFTEKSSEKSN